MSDGKSINARRDYAYAIKKSAEIWSSLCVYENDDDKYYNATKFLEAFNHKWNTIFCQAQTSANMRRQDFTRKPANLPDVGIINKIKSYLETQIEEISRDPQTAYYTHVRRIIHSYLVIINGRRCNEVSNIRLTDLDAAISNAWIGTGHENLEYFICYVPGKRQDVDVLIPKSLDLEEDNAFAYRL